jgi:tetratricopeptide (TPR) repeat protein
MTVKHRRAHGERKPAPTKVAGSLDVSVLFATALQRHQQGRLDVAKILYRQVLAVDRRHADSLHLLGVIEYQGGHHAAAVALIGQAIAINAGVAAYHSNLGNALRSQARGAAAQACFRRAVELQPDYAVAHYNLGLTLREAGHLDEAASCYRAAIRIQPDYPEAYNNLAAILLEQECLGEAADCYRKALVLRPAYPEALNNLGAIDSQQRRTADAEASFRAAIALRPDYPEAHSNLATVLLTGGRMEEGWREAEWRRLTFLGVQERRSFTQPQWFGEPAEGRTLLLHAEQGFGDTLQFCRYAGLAARRGLRVIIEAQKPLVRLLGSLVGPDVVIARGGSLPDFDLQCPMLSMPLAFGTVLDSIPSATSYLSADAEQVCAWDERLASLAGCNLKIGLVWAGSRQTGSPTMAAMDRRRSIAPATLAPLFDVSGVQFVSLQKDGPAAPDDFSLIELMGDMADFADTAALVANLDLVISVDTAVVHLAAALGKPVWLLDRFDSCWRWLADRSDSPWYPSLRLFRQDSPGDWEGVVVRVRCSLQALVREGRWPA